MKTNNNNKHRNFSNTNDANLNLCSDIPATKNIYFFNFYQKIVHLWQSMVSFQLIMLFIFIVIFGVLSFSASYFVTLNNLLNVIRQAAPTLIVAVGMTIVITSGGIDLSVGSMLAVGSVLSAIALSAGWHTTVTIAAIMLIGLVIGTINGFFIGYYGIAPFITTLASLSILRGIVLILTKGYSIPIPPKSPFILLGRGWVFGFPIPFLIALFVVFCGIILLYRTRFGLYVTGIGTNEEAVRRAGINTKRIKLYIYALSGLLSSIAGMVVGARLACGSSYTGIGFELTVITAVIMGGTSFSGGNGSMLGTILGAVLLAIIGNGLILLHISAFYIQIVEGTILLLAIWINQMLSKKLKL